MIDMVALAQWLDAVPTELDLRFSASSRQEEFGRGDLVGQVTAQPGPGLILEGMGSVASFQIKAVAREHQEPALRVSAFQLDDALLFGPFPAEVWGTRVISVDRLGGEPSSLPEDELDRVAYVCSYIAYEMPER